MPTWLGSAISTIYGSFDGRFADDFLNTGLDMANDIVESIPRSSESSPPETKTASGYWFDDGSVIARLRNHNFKVHKALLVRHSPYLASLSATHTEDHDVPTIHIPDERASVDDFIALLEHLYHDIPLETRTSSFKHVTSLLRVSSEAQLHYPSIYSQTKERFQNMYPTTLEHFAPPADAEQALKLAIEHNIAFVQKPLYYCVATTSHFDHGTSESESGSVPHRILPQSVTAKCALLQDKLISHFTPILFTVATASHMTCTDVFAEAWMPLVIAPALADNGLCTPIETLRKIQQIKWEDHGLCEECCKEKREEWEAEARNIWEKIDEWLGLDGVGGST